MLPIIIVAILVAVVIGGVVASKAMKSPGTHDGPTAPPPSPSTPSPAPTQTSSPAPLAPAPLTTSGDRTPVAPVRADSAVPKAPVAPVRATPIADLTEASPAVDTDTSSVAAIVPAEMTSDPAPAVAVAVDDDVATDAAITTERSNDIGDQVAGPSAPESPADSLVAHAVPAGPQPEAVVVVGDAAVQSLVHDEADGHGDAPPAMNRSVADDARAESALAPLPTVETTTDDAETTEDIKSSDIAMDEVAIDEAATAEPATDAGNLLQSLPVESTPAEPALVEAVAAPAADAIVPAPDELEGSSPTQELAPVEVKSADPVDLEPAAIETTHENEPESAVESSPAEPPAVDDAPEPLMRARLQPVLPPAPALLSTPDGAAPDQDREDDEEHALSRFEARGRSVPKYVPAIEELKAKAATRSEDESALPISPSIDALAHAAASVDPTLSARAAAEADTPTSLGAGIAPGAVADDVVVPVAPQLQPEPEPESSLGRNPVDHILKALINRAKERQVAIADVAAELIETANLDGKGIDEVLADLVPRVDDDENVDSSERLEELTFFNDSVPRRPGQLTDFGQLDATAKKRALIRVLCLLVAMQEDNRLKPKDPRSEAETRHWPLARAVWPVPAAASPVNESDAQADADAADAEVADEGKPQLPGRGLARTKR